MQTTRYTGLLVASFVLLSATTAFRAGAQETIDQSMGPSRVSVEPFLAQYFFDAGDDREGIGGFGLRAMVNRGSVVGGMNTFFTRARAGVFFTYTGEQKSISTFHFGGQAEVPLFAAPVGGGYLDPFFSLAVGAFRTKFEGATTVAGTSATSTDLALTPGAGTLIPLFGALAIRGDIRDVIIFGDETTNNFVFEGGLSIGF